MHPGVLIIDGELRARQCLRADIRLDPVTTHSHQNNSGDTVTQSLTHMHSPVHTHEQSDLSLPLSLFLNTNPSLSSIVPMVLSNNLEVGIPTILYNVIM